MTFFMRHNAAPLVITTGDPELAPALAMGPDLDPGLATCAACCILLDDMLSLCRCKIDRDQPDWQRADWEG